MRRNQLKPDLMTPESIAARKARHARRNTPKRCGNCGAEEPHECHPRFYANWDLKPRSAESDIQAARERSAMIAASYPLEGEIY